MMRFAPGFPLHRLSVNAIGCAVDIEDAHSGRDTCKVTLTPSETLRIRYAKTAGEALEQAAKDFERSAAALRELAKLVEKM